MGFIIGFVLGFLGAGGVAFALLDKKRKELDARQRRLGGEQAKLDGALKELSAKQKALDEETRRFAAARREFDTRAVKYEELRGENALLKRDLRNLDVACRKLQLDRGLQGKRQEELDQRAKDLGSRYLKDNVKRIGSALNVNNLTACEDRLRDVIERCRGIGLGVSPEEEATLFATLTQEFKEVERTARIREEEAARREQERDEQARQRGIEKVKREVEEAQREIEAKAKAKAEADAEHAARMEGLRREHATKQALDEAEAKYARESVLWEAERAKLVERVDQLTPTLSRAQQGLMDGYVYVISNVGSFRENVFKIGMTRRVEGDEPWMERINELGDASVPFPFDVQMIVSADNAPALELALHERFRDCAVNLKNPRKEFFKTDIYAILQFVQEQYGEVKMEPDGTRSASGLQLKKFEERAAAEQWEWSEAQRKTGAAPADRVHVGEDEDSPRSDEE